MVDTRTKGREGWPDGYPEVDIATLMSANISGARIGCAMRLPVQVTSASHKPVVETLCSTRAAVLGRKGLNLRRSDIFRESEGCPER